MVGKHVDISVGQLLAIHLFDAVGQQPAVQPDEARLGQLAYKSGNVLVLYVCIGVILRARGGVGCFAIIGQESQFLHRKKL